jgi:hypothetical protein
MTTAAQTQPDDAPRYTHDCDQCVFLGWYEECDLYFCARNIVTVIARYGNDGHEYTSGLTFTDVDPELAEAKKRAVERGLLPA